MYIKKKKSSLMDLGRQMQEVVDRAFRQAVYADPCGGAVYLPCVDIAETPDAVLVVLEIPGVAKEEVDVSVESGLLRIQGRRREFLPEGVTRFHNVEIDRGAFRRVIQIPPGFRLDDAEARLEDGLLFIRLPKEDGSPAHIEVKSQHEENDEDGGG